MRNIKAQIIFFICAFMFIANIEAQISIPNAELEGIPCIASGGGTLDSMINFKYCSIPSFFICEGYVGLYNSGLDNDDIYPDFPKQGSTYTSFAGRDKTTWWGSVSTKLPCVLRVGMKYEIKLWAANQFYIGNKVAKKTLVIWGNSDSCTRIEKLWESGQIDTGWHQYTAILTPQQQDYEYIHFRIGESDSNSYFLSLDALSDIYPLNANSVTATIQDTTFNKPNNTCIELNATTNITTYDSVYWQDAAGNKIAQGFNGGMVCADSSTYYIIAMRDSVPDCAGYWWSYDTVKVRVNTGTGIKENSNTAELFRIYPTLVERGNTMNVLASEQGYIRFTEVSGRVVGQYKFEKGINRLQLLELSATQLLLYDVTTESGKKYNGKIFVK